MCTHTVHMHSYIKASMLYTTVYLVGFLLNCTLLISPPVLHCYGCTDGHLGFRSLPFTNSPTTNSLIILGEIPEVELLHERVNICSFAVYVNAFIEIAPFFITNNVDGNSPEPHQENMLSNWIFTSLL